MTIPGKIEAINSCLVANTILYVSLCIYMSLCTMGFCHVVSNKKASPRQIRCWVMMSREDLMEWSAPRSYGRRRRQRARCLEWTPAKVAVIVVGPASIIILNPPMIVVDVPCLTSMFCFLKFEMMRAWMKIPLCLQWSRSHFAELAPNTQNTSG